MIQAIDSIPWVRCASGNVSSVLTPAESILQLTAIEKINLAQKWNLSRSSAAISFPAQQDACMSVLKHFQPPLVQIKIRRHISKVCSLWPWILFHIQNSRRSIFLFWFPIFLYIRFVFQRVKRSCQVASLALVPIKATRWRYLIWLPMWPPDGTTCISFRFGLLN